MTIPHPDNPEHVDNLKSISLLEAQGWEGVDVDLGISLYDYGLVWRTLPEENRTLFLFNVSYSVNDSKSLFARDSFDNDTNFREKFDWINWPGFLGTMGLDEEEWLDQSIGLKVYDLLNYVGYANVFGKGHFLFNVNPETDD